MITKAISQWYLSRASQQSSPLGLILHTSCVNYQLEHLRELAALPLYWILPDNVMWELRLLQQSRIFANHANFILERAGQEIPPALRGTQAAWDLEQLYTLCKNPVAPGDIFVGTLLFAFGDLNKLDEFLTHARQMPGHYVLLNSGWSCSKENAVVFPLEKFSGRTIRHVHPLSSGVSTAPLNALSGIECLQDTQMISGDEFISTGKYGSNARIYTCAKFPSKYIKIYKEHALTGNYAMKLKKLTSLKRIVGNMPMALPEKLLSLEEEQLIGYSMMYCRGKPMREFICNGWDEHNLETVFRNLVLLLLELHCLHIIVNDLSYNNVLVDEHDRVYLVDCDSFQVFHYPGGGITETYRHPEILCECCSNTLRQPRHEYFSFAVLVYQCLFYADPLQQVQSAADDRALNWYSNQFPFDTQQTDSENANSALRRLWEQQDPAVRTLFADEFHFRSDHSFGAWIRTLELLPPNL